eukprot:Skav236811  [mRNA]  locus=scaffold80:103497:107218:+ [translate_table: standard]
MTIVSKLIQAAEDGHIDEAEEKDLKVEQATRAVGTKAIQEEVYDTAALMSHRNADNHGLPAKSRPMAGPTQHRRGETAVQTQHVRTKASNGSGQLEDDWSKGFADACVGLLKYDKGDIKRLVVIGACRGACAASANHDGAWPGDQEL